MPPNQLKLTIGPAGTRRTAIVGSALRERVEARRAVATRSVRCWTLSSQAKQRRLDVRTAAADPPEQLYALRPADPAMHGALASGS